jgi:hypothetical protein
MPSIRPTINDLRRSNRAVESTSRLHAGQRGYVVTVYDNTSPHELVQGSGEGLPTIKRVLSQ